MSIQQMVTAVARREDELAKIATSVTNDEKRNPKIARETGDWETTVKDGLERKQDAHAKSQTR